MPIVISLNDGGVYVMGLSHQFAAIIASHPEHADTIIGAEIAQWPSAERDRVVAWRAVPDDAMPVDRAFRDAWRTSDGGVVVDMPAARDIHRSRMREARAPLLAALDIEYQRATEQEGPGAKRDVVTRKQVLRDVTADPAIDAAATPEELKALWPGVLKPAALAIQGT